MEMPLWIYQTGVDVQPTVYRSYRKTTNSTNVANERFSSTHFKCLSRILSNICGICWTFVSYPA